MEGDLNMRKRNHTEVNIPCLAAIGWPSIGKMLRVSGRTVKKYARDYGLPIREIEGKPLLTVKELEKFLMNHLEKWNFPKKKRSFHKKPQKNN